MRVLQLIDSLRPGGAEKMAVNIANALLPHLERSFLCCTRQEGMLKDEIKPEVVYLFLEKKSKLDSKAIIRLKRFIRENQIEIIHAHSTSFFLAGLLKLAGGNFKLIWHDHYGESENLEERKFKILKKFSRLFAGIISVNSDLKNWAEKNLNCKNIIEVKNFIPEPDPALESKIRLKGNEDDFKIICVANIRPQKDHMNLLQAFEIMESKLNVSLHLIGEDPATEYSASIFKAIDNSPVSHKIFYYGTQSDIISLLKQADLGVLTSRSEGLPLALLEYGSADLPVVSTNVGKCGEIIGANGILIEKENHHDLANALRRYIRDDKRYIDAFNLKNYIAQNYSEKIIIQTLIQFYSIDT